MLSDLEARLEDLLSDIAQMPEEYVAKAEKVDVVVFTDFMTAERVLVQGIVVSLEAVAG